MVTTSFFFVLLAISLVGETLQAEPLQKNKMNLPFQDIGAPLKQIEISLTTCRSAVLVVDVDSLPFQFKEGKMIDEMRKTCLAILEMIHQEIASLRSEQTLLGDFQLMDSLSMLAANMSELHTLLSSPITTSPSTHLLGLASGLTKALEELGPAQSVFFGHVTKTLTSADALLKNCMSR